MACEPHWTQYISALAVPLVAIFGSYIAFRQWRTANNKLKFELFENRHNIYKAATALISDVMSHGTVTQENISAFAKGTAEAKWLLNQEIADYLDKELYKAVVELECLMLELKGSNEESVRSVNIKNQTEKKQYLSAQYKVLEIMFNEYLMLSH